MNKEAQRLTVTEAARNFSDLVNRVYYRGESAILTRNGIPVAYLTPPAPLTRPAGELARDWAALPHLDPADAKRFAEELAETRRTLPPAEERWE
jgi:prevent-host-death family protein